MKKEGLLVPPDFSDTSKYLTSGNRTAITYDIRKISQTITGETSGMVLRNLLVWMHTNTIRSNNFKHQQKFKRTANEILQSSERTGCCDSSTLFTALARSKNIPTMQVITFDKKWANDINKGIKCPISGHYFTACYITDLNNNSHWVLVDSDKPVKAVQDVKFSKLDLNNRNIQKNFYAFAYVRDYSDIDYNGLKINSINDMAKIQLVAYKNCDKNDLVLNEDLER